MATTGGKQETTTKALKGCGGRAEARLSLTPLSWQREENMPPPLRGAQPAVSHPFWVTTNTVI